MSIATLCMWMINIGYLGAIFPQIILNYRLKTTTGLSDLYILGYFNGCAFYLFYVYGLNFPFAYKLITPMTLCAVSILILQRFWYNRSGCFKLYGYYFMIFLMIVPMFWIYPLGFGKIAGWVAMLTYSMYQAPQAFKIYKSKSVQGFSFYLISSIGIGNFVELVISWALSWPLQSILISVRGLIFYSIFCLQFWLYSRR